MIGNAIYNLLSSDPDVSAIVGTKIYPVRIEQKTNLPAIAYRKSGKTGHDTKQAVSTLDKVRAEVTAVHTKYSSIQDLAEKIRKAIEGKTGTFGGVQIHTTYFIDDEDDYDEDAQAYLRIITFEFFIKRN